ncbi:hypothetical protein QBC39DRAFT_251678 [Podospora conica]|nr:hypothetical protein QBC39DRAFT_251678 [Schizothecium conicum]
MISNSAARDWTKVRLGPRCEVQTGTDRLYFAAYADKIYVYQPRMSPQILPGPSVILTPRKSKAARMTGGAIDRAFPHQMNHILVGQLGELEIVCFTFDDGDVGAYYTHTIAQSIAANNEHGQAQGGVPSRNTIPKQFFHECVGLSAWGLAVHQQSRLVAVSSNRAEVTVFAFATTDNPYQCVEAEPGGPPVMMYGTTAWELEKHFQSRTRTWRIVLSTGPRARNMPSIAFIDDETGYADKVVAYDVGGNTWIMDIWTLGALPIHLPPIKPSLGWNMQNPRPVGWGVLVLPESSFMEVETASEVLGVLEQEALRANLVPESTPPSPLNPWLDTTCTVYYIHDLAPTVDALLQRFQNGPPRYAKVHAEAVRAEIHAQVQAEMQAEDTDIPGEYHNNSGGWDDDSDLSLGEGEDDGGASPPNVALSAEQRWKRLGANYPAPILEKGQEFKDLSETVQLSRTIIPRSGQTIAMWANRAMLISFTTSSENRNSNTTPIDFSSTNFSPLIRNLTLFRSLSTDFELQPFDRRSAGVVCRGILAHHNHHGRRTAPWDLKQTISERISMLLHVPELNLVVAGSLNGRVALLTLTKATAARAQGVRVRRGFRVDWVLPRHAEEEKRIRPWCALHGIAVSPVPDPKARGLDLHGRRGRPPHGQYRLLLHYVDHTILMYEISRDAGSDDLMIF